MRTGEHEEHQRLRAAPPYLARQAQCGMPGTTVIDVLVTSTTVVSDASYAQTRATAPRTWSEEFTRGHGQRQRSCVTDGTVARSQGECTSDEARQRVGTIEVACEASSCERYIWIIAPMHNSTLGIECGFQLVEGGVCVNCSVEPGARPNVSQHG